MTARQKRRNTKRQHKGRVVTAIEETYASKEAFLAGDAPTKKRRWFSWR